MDAVVTQDLRRKFDNKEVLKGINMNIKSGIIASLLGPNGAGKTTLIRILTTELMPSGGKAWILGFDVVKEADKVRRRIAVIPQDSSPITYMTPYEYVLAYLLLRGLSLRDAKKETRRCLDELGLWELRDKPIYELSGGMARRVLVATALASNADVIFLDEPTIGLDAMSRRVVWNALRNYVRSGATVFLTTHYIDEANLISDIVFLIDEGLIVDSGNPRELVEKLPGKYVIEYPGTNGKDCIRVGDICLSFVNSLDEVHENALRVMPKSLEHYVLITIKSWARGGEGE